MNNQCTFEINYNQLIIFVRFMKKKNLFLAIIVLVILIPVVIFVIRGIGAPNRPEGPCDVYAAGGTPCVAAHSSTRALYADYDGPLYQVMRQSDGKTIDIGVVKPSAGDAGGYADAEAQDKFCADTYCWITILYDQSGNGNDLYQAPRGGFSGPAMGGFNNVPLADWAPVTLMGHKVYGIHIAPGMGLRWNDAKGTAVDDQAEGQYWVISGEHYNSGCCFDYGNAETDSRDDGDGTMETTYFGNQGSWYHGQAPGPWVMTDQENNLVGCVNEDPNDKFCADLPSVNWRFVTATADGEPHHWRSMGGDAQTGDLIVMYDGKRIQNDRSSYDPMRKQGAILLGNGGDNSNGSAGTFYEAAMTAPNTFPSIETNQAVQANIVAAKYDVQRLAVTATDKINTPNGLQTFAPGSTDSVAVTFVNTTGEEINDLALSIAAPKGWISKASESGNDVQKISYSIAPGQKVIVTFNITSSSKSFNGDLKAKATWTASNGKSKSETAIEKVRNVNPVTINEFAISDGKGNSTNSFIELYNAGENSVDISGWTLTQHAINLPYFSSIVVPEGTKIDGKGYYLFGLSNSGLSVQAEKGDKIIYVREIKGINVGDEISIGTGSNMETLTVSNVISPAQPESQDNSPFGRRPNISGGPTTLWQPLPEGPVITISKGSTNIPVTSVAGFEVGGKMAIGYGATYPAVSNTLEKYEVVTITEVGKPGTQAFLSMDAKPGDTNIKVSSVQNISVGDKIRLDIESLGHGIETVTVKSVGTQSVRNTFNGPLKPGEDPGTGLELEEPLKFAHASNMPFSVNGTGISFEPATKYDHSSNEPVLPLVYAIELSEPLAMSHDIDDVVFDKNVTNAGYQGEIAADQLFGGPALSASQGAMVLRDAKGLVVDGLNYGGVVDPWLSEGHQGLNRANGNFVQAPAGGNRGRFGAPAAQTISPDLSSGRYPDGDDSDDNRADFNIQRSTNIAADAVAGDNNIKVSNVFNLKEGQTIIIGNGNNRESVTISSVGTAGGTTLTANVSAGSKKLLVSSSQNFSAGQEITVGNGDNVEGVQIASIAAARRGFYFGGMNRNTPTPPDTIILASPVRKSYKVGNIMSGTGVNLSAPLTKDHKNGDALVSSVPTPGQANRY